MDKYNHKILEQKWQKHWEDNQLFFSLPDNTNNEKLYLLFAFAYPSGSGLHVGHVESKTALDILARFYRMNGRAVFFPVGWDAFGLPAENYAIKTGVHPAETTNKAITAFKRQIKRLGISYAWNHELATNDPEYYRWTQWIFLKLYSKGLAYKAPGMVNWCPSCQTVLANEQVVDGECERCGTQVIQKQLEQWYFKITDYKDELISDLEQVDWPAPTVGQQLNWIGRAKGLNIDFTEMVSGQTLTVWTTYWQTVFGVSFLVISPEKFNQLKLINLVGSTLKDKVDKYIEDAFSKTEEERQVGAKDKTGVDTGLRVINPANGDQVPLFVADYVLANVGTGVVMGVPAHDERDLAFAHKFNLPVKVVIEAPEEQVNDQVKAGLAVYDGDGQLVNSGKFNGLSALGDGRDQMGEWMIEQGFANWNTTYKLRDWLISRQRYWGVPIPIVYDPQGKPHPVKDEHLPWILPTDVEFKPTGKSPLTYSKDLKQRVEELYGPGWTPEYDTMDTFVDSSWYYLRYLDPDNSQVFATDKLLKRWLPVDFYMIGPEHIVLHLLYSRFFTKFLRDEGFLSFDEPFMKMRHQGMILGPDNRKMSKSKGNVIDPDGVIEKYGADTLRLYEMFMGPIEADKPWNENSVVGVYRFLSRFHKLFIKNLETPGKDKGSLYPHLFHLHNKVGTDIPGLKFNTAVAMFMEFSNHWQTAIGECQALSSEELSALVRILAPFAPFLSEELWSLLGAKYPNLVKPGTSVHESDWSQIEPSESRQEDLTVVVQVNGKAKTKISISSQLVEDESAVVKMALAQPRLKPYQGQSIKRVVFVSPMNNRVGIINLIF